jgi:maltooligosyltrehalose synthase
MFAFGREAGGVRAVVAAPRLTAGLVPDNGAAPVGDRWEGTRLRLAGFAGRYRNVLTGETVHSGDGVFDAKTVFARFPVAILVAE